MKIATAAPSEDEPDGKTGADQALTPRQRQLAALRPAPPFKPGQSGNPAGRPAAGLAIIEWYNQLQNTGEEELEKIAKDKKVPANKRAAAIEWLTAISQDRNASGVPINGAGADRIIDRTAGKAASNNNVHFSGSVNQIVINASVIGRMPPDKLQALYAMIADYLPQEPLTLDDHTNDASNPTLEVTQAKTLPAERHKAD